MDAVISSLDRNYRLCETRITDSEIILYITSTLEQLCCPYCGSHWTSLDRLRQSKLVKWTNLECLRLTRGGIGMQSETTTAITAVKQDVRLREWAEQLEAQQASGLTVPQWCAENGIKTKSFYYRLRRVREQ